MAKVVWHATMSLDGFIAGPDDAMEWVFGYDEPAGIDEIIASVGALLVGRNTYMVGFKEEQVEGAQEPYGGRWLGPQFVLAHDPSSLPTDPSVTFVSGDIGAAVDIARAAAGDKNVEVLGADVARQCIEARVLDEIFVHIVPVLLGAGVRFYGGGPETRLACVEVTRAGQTTSMRFRVSK
jgi:dihydrofolate reductase